ncbi:response regulator [Nonomuraea salmonea]|uniref:histidine kinase n=1 Tax=Nonomuraea salmonea TaxID=46181 RepID=A0ABV5NJ02_9ACTN
MNDPTVGTSRPSAARGQRARGQGEAGEEPELRRLLAGLTAVRDGDFRTRLPDDADGLLGEIASVFNGMVDQLSLFTSEVTRVAREVGTDGRLGGQADVPAVSGTWKDLTESVNELAGNLTRQVRAIAEVTSAVTSGDLTRSITVDAEGELADLKDNINSMVKSLRETTTANEQQDWLTSNLARMSGLMQGHRDLTTVAELVMNELAPLVSAQYGAFFSAEDSELKLISGYGYPVDPERPTRFRLGEALVGQAARSRRTIAMTDLPPGYITIASGLGRTDPSSVIVLPIVVEEQVLGVIELASVQAFTPVHRAFLDQLMETIGVNLNTIVANARTDELLKESQRLAVELQARSEELLQQQEELQRSNAELEEKATLLARQNQDIETKNLEIEQARQELEDRAHQLSLASTYKSEFLANMSHELRTPLNSLLILAQLLAQNHTRNLTPKQVEYAGIIHSAGSDLLQLINDILDLSKVEAGKMNINLEWVQLRRLLDYVEATFRPMTGQKGLDFRVTLAPGVPAELLTDDSRLRQVLRNLLSNAVKFTETGSVELRIEPAAPGELPASVRPHGPAIALRVVDTGVGIPGQQLEVIFGAFQQADGTTSRKYGGTGLGLSICREIAYLLGGAITVRSTPGQGSVFSLYLPVARPGYEPGEAIAPAEGAPAQPAERAPVSARRLLVIEERRSGLLSLVAESVMGDLATARDLGGTMEVVTAAGPEEAARLLGGEPCHCIVLDLDMPDMSSYQVLAAMDGDPRLRGVPVLAYNNWRSPPQQEVRLAHQPLELLSSLDELRERIALHLTAGQPGDVLPLVRSGAVNAPEGRGTDNALAGRTVLVVDDDARNLYALTSMLELHGITVLHAENGRTGIDTLTAHPETDLILMDVMMPEMDGYTATETIRSMPRYAHLPIIAVTAKAMPGDQEKSLTAGASDHVTKPVDADHLIARIRHWLDLS